MLLKTIFAFMSENTFTWVECPRDAMQGWSHFIPTAEKVKYLNSLLKVGFDVLDAGSFVSPKAIPQMADTRAVLPQLDMDSNSAKLLVIVANMRGTQEAVTFDEVSYIGFPFSVSETFQQRNTNKSIVESLKEVEEMQNLCVQRRKELVVYLSMGFGNPYGDEYSTNIVGEWVRKLAGLGIQTLALSDTVGVASPEDITSLFQDLIPAFPIVNFGGHFHSSTSSWKEKMDAAWRAGCKRYDTAMKGIGGCPMAKDDLVGNMATENVLHWAKAKGMELRIDNNAFEQSIGMAGEIFN